MGKIAAGLKTANSPKLTAVFYAVVSFLHYIQGEIRRSGKPLSEHFRNFKTNKKLYSKITKLKIDKINYLNYSINREH